MKWMIGLTLAAAMAAIVACGDLGGESCETSADCDDGVECAVCEGPGPSCKICTDADVGDPCRC